MTAASLPQGLQPHDDFWVEAFAVKAQADELEPASEEETPGPRRLAEDVQGFVISISKRFKLRRLHRLHGCGRSPGILYCDFEGPLEEVPHPSEYDAFCKDCWPGKGPAEEPEEVEPDSSSTDAGEVA